MKYASLHCHSTNSLLDGIASPAQLVERAVELGLPAIGLTDHGSLSGGIKLYKAAKEHGIKPIVGIEAYLCDDIAVKKGSKNYHITIWVKSMRGLKSLFRLMTRANDPDAFYYRPRIELEMLYETEDLIVGTACAFGILNHPNYIRMVDRLHDYFEDDFYLEIMPLDFETQKTTNEKAIALSEGEGIKVIATGDVHYLRPEDQRLHNFLLNLHTDGKLQFDVSGLYLKSYIEMVRSFQTNCPYLDDTDIGQALANTLEIADKCELDWPESSIVLPKLTDRLPMEVLKERLSERISNRYPDGFPHKERLNYECEIIESKGFTGYFILVSDLVDRAKKRGVPMGPGRGSAAGALVCYILGITDIDPIKEGLMFERFLNPERSDWPDIDLDFSQRRRHEVIEDLITEFGAERVSYISTVSKLKLKSAFKDVAKKLKIPFKVANEISERLDDTMTMEWNVEQHPGIAKMVQPANINDVVYFTDGLNNTLRHESTHAAGIVIAPSAIADFGVLEKRKDSRSINWDMNDVSYQGLVKIDVLGLRTLDILDDTVQTIEKRHKTTIDWSKIDLNTPGILEPFGAGDTIGIFQFEKYSTRRLVKELNPIIDKKILVDCNALVRPGPLDSGMTQQYIDRHKRAHGGRDSASCGRHEGFDVEHSDALEPYADFLQAAQIAEETYSVIIYQEQVIAVLQKLAGYSIPQADVVRRVMAKKKGDMEAHRKEFVRGTKRTARMPNKVADLLFDHLETFSRYGFNKSHAAAYTELGLRQMWLKINYPLEYMAALFKYTTEKAKKIKFVEECQRLKIPLLPPDINISDADFKIEGNSIRVGLAAINGVGEKALQYIRKQRQIRPFKDVMDFRLRIPKSQIDVRALYHLILAGCFSASGINQKLWAEDLIGRIQENGTLKGLDEAPDIPDYTPDEKEMQRAVLIPGIWKMQIKPELGLNIDEEALEAIRMSLADCQSCKLREVYDCPVPFEYTDYSSIMVIAEAPGEDETRLGRPLIGKAGDELIIKQMRPWGITRSDLYLTNVYKCRPLNNKLPDDVTHDCYEILKMEIDILKPRFILALGNHARQFFTGQKSGIQTAAEKLRCEVEIVSGRPVPVLYGVHPASCFYKDGDKNRVRLANTVEVLANIIQGRYEEEIDGDDPEGDSEAAG